MAILPPHERNGLSSDTTPVCLSFTRGAHKIPMLTIVQCLAAMPRTAAGCRSVWSWRPLSVASFQLVTQLKRECPSFRTIIDGGANVGQFARAAVSTFTEAKVYSIEPLPDIAQKLRRNLSDNDRITVLETCVGQAD